MLAVGGMAPSIVHFTRNKPFHGPREGALGHQYLCSSEELRRRAFLAQHGVAPGTAAAASRQDVPATAGQPAGDHAQEQRQQQQRQQAVEMPAAGSEQEARLQQQAAGTAPQTDALLQQGQKELP
jgi:type IV secretory pathway VirB10-like protein